MSNFNSSKPAQLISGVGNFNKSIGDELDFGNDRCLVGVVSIMGVQSSGKSTLMNRCFFTDFSEMNQESGMSQTTKGISVAKLSLSDARDCGHKILILDCEGSDGAEREKEGSDVFEKQVTLFALASSDVVMINMKCDSVNLNNGAGMPLIRNVFQVMVRKFNTPRRVTLIFVLRDKNMVSLENLKRQLINQLTGVWKKVCQDLTAPYPALEDFFKVEVVALSNYHLQKKEFMGEVAGLREWIFDVVEKSRLSQAANFISFAQKNWIDIQEDKILNLQLNKNSVDEEFFMKIKAEIFQKFSKNQGWVKMKNDVRGSIAKGFGEFVSSLIESHVSEFDEETQSFNEKLRDDFRAQLTESLLEVVVDSYHSFLKTKKDSYLDKFKKEVKEKIEALDKNINAEEYTSGFFDTLKEAHIKQAKEWVEAYESFDDVKSSIKQQVDEAYSTIEDRNRQIAERLIAEAEEARREAEEAARREAEEAARREAEEALKKAAEAARGEAQEARREAQDARKEAVEAAQREAEGARGEAQEARKEALEAAQREAEEARRETQEARKEAEEAKIELAVDKARREGRPLASAMSLLMTPFKRLLEDF